MRTNVELARWNDKRGFGFNEPVAGTLVHISFLPYDGIRSRSQVPLLCSRLTHPRACWIPCGRGAHPAFPQRLSGIGYQPSELALTQVALKASSAIRQIVKTPPAPLWRRSRFYQ
jgi:hypothetical protein